MKESISEMLTEKTGVRARLVPILWRFGAVIGFAGLIAIGALVRIDHARLAALFPQAKLFFPASEVPVTLQTFFVLLAGALLGPVDGAIAVAVYLGLGVFGVPLFALSTGATGFSYFTGITGGYLIGFFAAAVFVGFAVRKFERISFQAAVFCAGSILILTFGTVWLKFVSDATFARALAAGVAPFLLLDGVKTAIAFVLYRLMRIPKGCT